MNLEVVITEDDLEELVHDWADAGITYLIALCQNPIGSEAETEALSQMDAAHSRLLSGMADKYLQNELAQCCAPEGTYGNRITG